MKKAREALASIAAGSAVIGIIYFGVPYAAMQMAERYGFVAEATEPQYEQPQYDADSHDEARAAARPISKAIVNFGYGEGVIILTDHASGCQYLQTLSDRGSITPRLRGDGAPDCNPARKD